GQRHLVPDRGQRLRQVRVPAEDCSATGDRGPVRRPRVGVGEVVNLIRQQLAELVKHARRRVGDRGGVYRTGCCSATPGKGRCGCPARRRACQVCCDGGQRKLDVRAWVIGRLGVGRQGREPVGGFRLAEGLLQEGVVQGAGRVVELLG